MQAPSPLKILCRAHWGDWQPYLNWKEPVIEKQVVVRMRLHKEGKPSEQETKVSDKVPKAQLEEKLRWQDYNNNM